MMGRGDFSCMFRRAVTRTLDSYNSTSLYYRNIAFCLFGALAGGLWGIRERKTSSAKKPNEAAVRLAFYNVPLNLDRLERPGSHQRHPPPSELERSVSATEKRRRFEKLWEDTAKKMQRLPGYAYTLMFRKLSCAESLAAFSRRDSFVASEGLENKKCESEECISSSSTKSSDQGFAEYMELRVWEGHEEPKDARFLEKKEMDSMIDIGVSVASGRYFRVFDDAIVRIIR